MGVQVLFCIKIILTALRIAWFKRVEVTGYYCGGL
jgi:hypothetical protein